MKLLALLLSLLAAFKSAEMNGRYSGYHHHKPYWDPVCGCCWQMPDKCCKSHDRHVAAKKRYDGYSVFEVVPINDYQLEILRKLENSTLNHLDFWLEPTHVNRPVHILVSPDDEPQLRWTLELNRLNISVYIDDAQRSIDDFDARFAARLNYRYPEKLAYNYSDYNPYSQFITELDNLNAICNEADGLTCETEIIGQSYECRDLKVLRINTGADQEFWIDSLIHCREWLAGATVMNIVNKMLTEFDGDDDVRRVLFSYNWIILPVMNPDGYEYTFTGERYWRKSRSPNDGSTCIGTDLNRNYDYGWGQPGASSNPCADTYRGSEAASEIETQLVQAHALSYSNIVVWLTFHTYGYYWLEPYGDGSSPGSPQKEDLRQVTDATCAAIEGTNGDSWACGNSREELYATSGTTMDWAIGAAGAYYVWIPELRGPGFNPPAAAIGPSVEEIWNGLVAKVDKIADIGRP